MSGSQNLRQRLAMVVFPAPDGPTRATVLPRGTEKDTSTRAGRQAPGYVSATLAGDSPRAGPRDADAPARPPGPSITGTGSACTPYTRRAAPSVSASWR